MTVAYSRVFTLEVDGRAILAFEANNTRQAKQLCKETWLLDDLKVFTSDGVPLCSPASALSVRTATPEETTFFEQAAAAAKLSDDMVLAYLVELDV
jgi:hypothetical protein